MGLGSRYINRDALKAGKDSLIKIYRAAQQWDQWLTQSLGQSVLDVEKKFLIHRLGTYYGKHGILIGVPNQHELLKTSVTAHQVVLTPLVSRHKQIKIIESDFYELPVASGSVDLVLLPHSLEYTNHPRQLLTEACRIVKPEGHIFILGFNPYGLWRFRHELLQRKKMSWHTSFIPSHTVKNWLALADFELVNQDFILYSSRFKWIDRLGHACFRPLGGVYSLIAKAKVTPLTPIRLRWQQTFSTIRVTMPGPSMRKF